MGLQGLVAALVHDKCGLSESGFGDALVSAPAPELGLQLCLGSTKSAAMRDAEADHTIIEVEAMKH